MVGKKIKIKFLFFIGTITACLFLSSGRVQAEDAQFIISIDNENLQTGVSANLTVSVINAQNATISEIIGLDNFDVLSNSQSQSEQSINGVTTSEIDINYAIMPKSIGDYTLQATVEYDGKTYQTNELKVIVTESSEKTDSSGASDSDLYIKTNFSGKEMYLGQKKALSYELYTRYNLENYGFTDDVNIDGFVSNEISEDKLTSGYVTDGGKKYARYELKQMFLSPIKTGTYTIPSFNFQANVSTGDFFSTSQPYYLQTESEKIMVKPLPTDNKPSNFSGIVGKLNIDATYDKQEVDYGDSITLNVTISGNCNLDSYSKVIHDELPDFSVYETEKSSEESIQDNQYFAKKEFNIILVPEKTGNLTIDPITISFFDPETEKYDKAEIAGTNITVKGEVPQVTTNEQSSTNKAVEINQVRYETDHKDGTITIKLDRNSFFIGGLIFAVLLILVLAILLYFKIRKRYDKTLLTYYKQLDKTNDQNEIYNIFNMMMKHCFDINLKANSRDTIVNLFNENKMIESKLKDAIIEVVDSMEKLVPDSKDDIIKNKIKGIYKKLIRLSTVEI